MDAYRICSAEDAKRIRDAITGWAPGKSKVDKANDEAPCPNEISKLILDSVIMKAHFIESISQPKFNRYRDGGHYESHTDAAIQFGVRSDLACTLFLSDDYDGGELVIDGIEVKLPAGEAIVYECWKPHEVRPVTRGERIAVILWLQSYIRSQEQRDLLSLLRSVVIETKGEHYAKLGAVHERLVKMWWR